MGAGHPESPSRLRAIENHFVETGLMDDLTAITAQPVTESALLRAHPKAYLTELQALSPTEGLAYADPDTALNCPGELQRAGAVG